MSVHRTVICVIFITSHTRTFTQIHKCKCKRTILPTPCSYTYWLARHTDYQVRHQGQSVHPPEDERKRGGVEGGEDQGGNERVERAVGEVSID